MLTEVEEAERELGAVFGRMPSSRAGEDEGWRPGSGSSASRKAGWRSRLADFFRNHLLAGIVGGLQRTVRWRSC